MSSSEAFEASLKHSPRYLSRDLIARIEAEEARREERRTGINSFPNFVKQAWPLVPQVDPLVWNWHLDAMCTAAEAVARGRVFKLALNCPPSFGKSAIISVLYPAWVWTWWPKCQFLTASYEGSLASRDNWRALEVISSDWYQRTYAAPNGWRLTKRAANHYRNSAGGERLSTGVGGVGRRAHIILLDDPNNVQEIYSAAHRKMTNNWIGQIISQRFILGIPRLICIQQRAHVDDATGFLTRGRDVQHLFLQSEFESRKRCSVFFQRRTEEGRIEQAEEMWHDPRLEEGELLFPKLWPRGVLEGYKQENELGPAGYAAQHQQRPTAQGGNVFRVDRWRFWRSVGGVEGVQDGQDFAGRRAPVDFVDVNQDPAREIVIDDIDEMIISMDPTFRKTKAGSFVAIGVWGKLGARRMLLDLVHARMDFDDQLKALLGMIAKWPMARRKVIEAKANGDAILSTLEKQHGITGLEPADPGTDGKEKRAHAMLPYQKAGNVELPDGAEWVGTYIAEHAAFPGGATDDLVDMQSQALAALERGPSPADRYNDIAL